MIWRFMNRINNNINNLNKFILKRKKPEFSLFKFYFSFIINLKKSKEKNDTQINILFLNKLSELIKQTL